MPHAAELVPLPEGQTARSDAAVLANALSSGGIVGLPSESVYTLAARVDDVDALARLAALVEHAPDRPTWMLATPHALETWPSFGPRAGRLAQRYWPGPLNLVLPGAPSGCEHLARDGWTSVRVPAHEGARAVLLACEFPVVALDAWTRAQSPCLEAAELIAAFGDAVVAIGDGGRCRLGESATTLVCGPGRFDVVHTGILDRADLIATSGRHVAFVCTGNTCRSPMAQIIAMRALARRLGLAGEGADDLAELGFEVASFGVAAMPGARAAQHALTAMRQRGLDLASHRSAAAIPEELSRFDEIYGLTRAHVQIARSALPPRLASRVHVLDHDGRDIADPVGGSLEDYLACAVEIEAAIEKRAGSWA